ncbi:hypothetical protein PV326_013968 [Microctonus aethiopoides]|nr:hypothetical protein PV326_013968 [Microctonus aethiopoides]
MDEKNVQDSIPYIRFEPSILDFKERQLGVPHQETVTLFNKDNNKTIHLSSISGSTQHFHSSFFQDKVIPPLGNTTFNVVFLGREEGEIDSHLYIHTSDGTLKYQVKGASISSPYRLRPVVGVKLPLNASFTPLIYMHNPHPEAMQVIEVYSSGGEFQLELPSGEAEGPRELWEIPPYQTKPIIRLHFNAYMEKNHTAYVRFKVNNSAELMVVAVEVEVGSGAGLHWGGSSASINLGMGGSLQPSIHYPIALKNSAKKPVKVLNVISTPVSKALKIEFEPVVIQGDSDNLVTVGTMIYDWKTALDLQHFKGKLVVKGLGPGGSTQKLSIPWVAEVLQGGLEVNATVTHYCSPHSNQPRNFTVINRFKIPLAITNVSLANDAKALFNIKNFIPRILKPGQKANIFSLHLNNERKNDNIKLESSIFIYSNVSTTEVPLLSYDGKVRKIISGERDGDRGTMNFGTVSSGTENEAIFALENQNPVNIELHGWGVNMPGAVLELMGCQSGPTDHFNKGIRNITVCSHTGNQSIKPGYLAIFKIKVKTPMVEEDTIVGDVFVRTTYERLTVPVYMRVAHGRISLKKLTFTDCFPGSICMQQIKIHSTFARSMEVTFIAPVHKDTRVKYIPLEESSLPTISKGDNLIGNIRIDPSITCKQQCYLGLSINTTAGSQWLNTMNLPSHTRDSDLNLLNARYSKYVNSTGGHSAWDNITMRLDTTEVRGHNFYVNIKPYWPSIVQSANNLRNRSILNFSLTQVGNTSYRYIKIYNPSTRPLLIQLVMDWNYPQGSRLYHSLPMKFKPTCVDCPTTIDGEFKLVDDDSEREIFEKIWDVTTAIDSLPFNLNPGESKTIKLSYTPFTASSSSGLLYIRNNMTILEVIRLVGRGAHAQFKFGNRKPGSNTPLLFELAEKHLKDCERERMRKNPVPNLTVKRSFTARNTGELPIDIHGFYISGLLCEGYGFKILNCGPFKLNPNATKKIEIAFTPDFTLSKIERELLILTSLGTDSSDLHSQNGMIKLSMLTTVPAHTLENCATVLIRPTWEYAIQWAAISLSCISLMCILAVSFLEADRILRGALATMSRSNLVQPPLDLRQLATQQISSSSSSSPPPPTTTAGATTTTTTSTNREKANEERGNSKKREEPDWSLMNVKKGKEKDQKGLKIPDWSLEEERKFRMDMEAKNVISNKQDESIEIETTLQRKKKKILEHTEVDENDKKCIISTKSSPTSNRKGKKEEKIEDTDINLSNDFKEKRKSSTSQHNNNNNNNINNNNNNNNNSNSNNNNTYKKYDSHTATSITTINTTATSQKVQYSEEETSSTTTESSTQEDPIAYKDEVYSKLEKPPRKQTIVKKNKLQTSPVNNTADYKDNYEGDCDDDDSEKDRGDNPNRWKTNTSKSTTKNSSQQSSSSSSLSSSSSSLPLSSSKNNEGTYGKVSKIKNPPKKDKSSQKRKGIDKIFKSVNSEIKPEIKSVIRVSSPLPPPPPPPSRWGENRARFSDVVARNPESISPEFSTSKKSFIKREVQQNIPTHIKKTNQNINNVERQQTQEIFKPTVEYAAHSAIEFNASTNFCAIPDDRNASFVSDTLAMNIHRHNNHHSHSHLHNNQHNNQQASNSYFINTFEQPFERELVPYDDLPETDEPLVELESLEEDTRSPLWSDKSHMTNLLSNNMNNYNRLDTPKHVDKLNNLTDSLKDNWVSVETNWEPLYTRGAVGEERSGVWGVNTGGVWAAAPWGAPSPPTIQMPVIQSTEQDSQERSGFDPFRSLSTIWTPTTSWSTKREE